MSRYLASRLVEIVVTLALMSLVVYLLIGLMPGDPIDLMISADPRMTSADAERLRAVYGIDRPLLERYLAWAGQALQGNFGYSRSLNQPVLAVLWPRLLNTLELAGIAFLLSVAIALPIGVWTAARPKSRADYAVNLLSFAGISTPPFWLALLLIMLFSVKLGVLPAGGMAEVRPGTSSGQKLRLAGRGLPKPRGGAGDLYAVAQIVVPQQLSERERELYGELQAASNENPRRHMENA